MSIYIYPLTTKRIPDLYPLYRIVYGHSRAAGYYEKKYATIYPDHPPVGFIAYDGPDTAPPKAIGFYGALPCYLSRGEHKVPAAQCADAMTHPYFRRQGLFARLARETMSACEQSG